MLKLYPFERSALFRAHDFMNVILVDDDPAALRLLTGFCSMIDDVTVTGSFSNAEDAFSFAQKNPPQVAILDIIMPVENGITLTDRLQAILPDLLIFYATASDEYALSAYKRHAVSYILKPYSFADILDAMDRAKLLCSASKPHIFARTFGHFDLFINGTPLSFPRKKSKELLAYLIDRNGGSVSMEQLIDALWEDRAYDESVRSYFHVVLRDLKKTLKNAGIPELLVCSRDQNAINPALLDCDYYNFLNGNLAAIHSFQDEYMTDYSWSEPTVASLMEMKRNFV